MSISMTNRILREIDFREETRREKRQSRDKSLIDSKIVSRPLQGSGSKTRQQKDKRARTVK